MMRKILVLAHSIPFLYIYIYIYTHTCHPYTHVVCAKFRSNKNSREAGARVRAHEMRFILHACIHTCVCDRHTIAKNGFGKHRLLVMMCCTYILVYVCVCKKTKTEMCGSVETRPTNRHARIDSIFLAALYELYDIDKPCTQKRTLASTHIRMRLIYMLNENNMRIENTFMVHAERKTHPIYAV